MFLLKDMIPLCGKTADIVLEKGERKVLQIERCAASGTRKPEAECSAFFRCRINCKLNAVKLRDGLNNRQTQSMTFTIRGVEPFEAAENIRQLPGSNTDAGINNAEFVCFFCQFS